MRGSFMAFSIVGIDPLYAALGKDIGGIVISQVVPSPRRSAIPIVKEYLAAIDNSDQTPSYEGMEGFIAAKALAEAVRRAGQGFTPAGLQRAMAGDDGLRRRRLSHQPAPRPARSAAQHRPDQHHDGRAGAALRAHAPPKRCRESSTSSDDSSMRP